MNRLKKLSFKKKFQFETTNYDYYVNKGTNFLIFSLKFKIFHQN